MTCASYANRIERGLNRLKGVQATVNYAAEKAAVVLDPGQVSPGELVEAAGYQARLPPAGRRARRRTRGRDQP